MKTFKLLLLIYLVSINTVFAQEKNSVKLEPSYLELPRIQVIPLKDTQANRQYELYIKLPEAYSENNDKSYPVIYTTDAMWNMEMLSGSTEYMLEEIILVGISWQKDIDEGLKKEVGEHVSRFRDYSFRKSNKPEIQTKFQFGQGNNHLGFIRNDIIPYMDNTYRTDPNSRTYFGYSMGGEFGAYVLLSQPDTFNNYIIGSPSIKNEVEYLSELNTKFGPYETSNRSSSLNANVFISYGSLEETMMEPIEAFIKLLNDRRDDGLTVLKEVIDGNHGTAFPMTVMRSISWLAQLNETVVKSPYLGQKVPGLVPKPFAPGTVTSENWEYGGVFTPDLKEFYFIREVPGSEKQEFVVFEYKNEQWEQSVISSRVGQPFISPDGKTMHLGKRYKKRTETGWSEIERLGSPFEEIQIMRMTSSSKGTYVFDEIGMPNGDGVLRYSRLIEGKREAPRPFGKTINTGRMNAHPFIAPDESYLIFDGEREGGFGDSDLYISFRQEDGSWGTAINLGEAINTEAWEAAATVTPDGKYLFFNRNIGSNDYENVDIFWVDAKVIEDLRPKP
ncbi:alpha/beta hydrolase-fold protein [Allomuricauda sp. R78024]|uniref:alpha/beta hydrolase-fold protein n=1 Tax=Allomuricauda sp. R78024 TaxID=3093867 RepID=UPI0037C632F2